MHVLGEGVTVHVLGEGVTVHVLGEGVTVHVLGRVFLVRGLLCVFALCSTHCMELTQVAGYYVLYIIWHTFPVLVPSGAVNNDLLSLQLRMCVRPCVCVSASTVQTRWQASKWWLVDLALSFPVCSQRILGLKKLCLTGLVIVHVIAR